MQRAEEVRRAAGRWRQRAPAEASATAGYASLLRGSASSCQPERMRVLGGADMRDRLLRRKRLSRAQVLAALSMVAIFGSALAVTYRRKSLGYGCPASLSTSIWLASRRIRTIRREWMPCVPTHRRTPLRRNSWLVALVNAGSILRAPATRTRFRERVQTRWAAVRWSRTERSCAKATLRYIWSRRARRLICRAVWSQRPNGLAHARPASCPGTKAHLSTVFLRNPAISRTLSPPPDDSRYRFVLAARKIDRVLGGGTPHEVPDGARQ